MVILLLCRECNELMSRVDDSRTVRCRNGHELEVHGYAAWPGPSGQLMQSLLDKGWMNTMLEDMGLPPVEADGD